MGIRIVEKKRARRFEEMLEEEASRVARSLEDRVRDASIPSTLEEQIALAVEQLRQVREQNQELQHRLLLLECGVGTDILQLEPRPHEYVDQHREKRLSLKSRLLKIEGDRQRLSLTQLEKEQALHEKLLSLLQKLKLVRG